MTAVDGSILDNGYYRYLALTTACGHGVYHRVILLNGILHRDAD